MECGKFIKKLYSYLTPSGSMVIGLTGFSFPIIVMLISNLLKFNRHLPKDLFVFSINVIEKNLSYYATAFSIFFAIYAYNSNQNTIEKKRLKEEKSFKKIQSEEFERDMELRERELEAKNNLYRPTFIINENKIIVSMKDSRLYLENIIYFPIKKDGIGKKRVIGLLSDGSCIELNGDKYFVILAETILGEKILFGNINGDIRIYKYLKSGENPLESYNLELDAESNKIWLDYNSSKKLDSSIEKYFLQMTAGARESFVFSKYNLAKNILSYNTLEQFLNGYFTNILTEFTNYSFSDSSIICTCDNILSYVKSNFIENIEFDYQNLEFNDLKKIEGNLQIHLSDYKSLDLKEDKPIELFFIIGHISNYLSLCENNRYALMELLKFTSRIFMKTKVNDISHVFRPQFNYLIILSYNNLEYL